MTKSQKRCSLLILFFSLLIMTAMFIGCKTQQVIPPQTTPQTPTPPKTYTYAEQNIDFAKAFVTFEIGESKLLSVYVNGEDQGPTSFACENGYFMLLPALFEKLGVGTHTLNLTFDDGSGSMVCVVTNEKPLAITEDFSVNQETFVVGDTITLPMIERAQYSIQDFTVNCYLQKDGENREELSVRERELTEKGTYSYIAEIVNDSGVIETRTQQFTVLSKKEALEKNLVQSRYLSYFTNRQTQITYEENVTINGKTVNAFHITSSTKADRDNQMKFSVTLLKELIAQGVEYGYTTLKLTMYSETNGMAGYVGGTSLNTIYSASINKTYMLDLSVYQGAGILLAFFDTNANKVDTYITNITFTKIDYATNIINEELLDFKAFTLKSGVSATYEENAVINSSVTSNAIHITSTSTLPVDPSKHNGDYKAVSYFAVSEQILKSAKDKGYSKVIVELYTDNQIDLATGDWLTQVVSKHRNNTITAPTTIEVSIETFKMYGIYFVLGGGGTANVYVTSITFA